MKPYVTDENPQWRYEPAPRKKCLLLSDMGVAYMGPPTGAFREEYIAWCPLPKRDRVREKELGL